MPRMDKLTPKLYVILRRAGDFCRVAISEAYKNSSRAGSVAKQLARLKLIAEGKFVHSQNKYIFSKKLIFEFLQ